MELKRPTSSASSRAAPGENCKRQRNEPQADGIQARNRSETEQLISHNL